MMTAIRIMGKARSIGPPVSAGGRGAEAVAIDHPDIAGIDGQRQGGTQQQWPFMLMHDISETEQAAYQAAIPEGDRDDAMAFLFAPQPLNQEADAEHDLP